MRSIRRPAPDQYAPALDDVFARSLTPIAFVLSAMYLTWVIHRALDPELAASTAPTAIVPTLVFLALGVLFLSRPIPAPLANPVMLLAIGFMTVETLGRGETAAGVNLHWALIGLGALVLRPRWLVGCDLAVIVPWFVVAALGLNGWTLAHGGFALDMVTATALGGVIFWARRNAVLGMFRARNDLQQQALHDPLTSIYNRRGVEAGVRVLLTQAGGRPLELLFVDLDGFKGVNDRHGHAAGDAVLVAVAEMLRDAFRAGDVIGRVGGDEFVVVLAPGSDAETAQERLVSRLHEVSERAGGVAVGASVGKARLERTDVDGFWAALVEADHSMYAQKQAKRAARGA